MAVHAREAEKGVLNNVYMCKEVKIGCIGRGWWRDEQSGGFPRSAVPGNPSRGQTWQPAEARSGDLLYKAKTED